MDLAHHHVRIPDVLEHREADDEVEARVAKRQRVRVGEHRRALVDVVDAHPLKARVLDRARVLTAAAAEIEAGAVGPRRAR
jgi:hypothetical protein